MLRFMTAAALVIAAGAAHAKDARCELTTAGKTWIDGPCDFTGLGDDGSFMVTAPNGYFAYANRDGDQMRGSWNGPYKEGRAHDDLGMLDRDGACWVNNNSRLCAW